MSTNLNRAQLAAAIAERTGDGKACAERAVEAFVDIVGASLGKGIAVSLLGFGVFEPVRKEARTGRNPSTGESVEIPAKTVAKFRPSAALHAQANSGRAATGTPRRGDR